MTLPPAKICEGCECEFRRPTGTARISDEKWRDRRFCSAECGLHAAGASADHLNPGAPSVYDHHRLGASQGSEALLKRCQALYRRVARERALNDIWEAAVLMGMAA